MSQERRMPSHVRFCRFTILVLLLLSTVPYAAAQRSRALKDNRHKVTSEAPPSPPTSSERDAGATTEYLSLAGQMLPVLKKFAVAPEQLKTVFLALSEAVDLKEFGILAFVGWACVPLVQAVHDAVAKRRMTEEESGSKTTAVAQKPFTDSYVFQFVRNVSQAARIGALVYAVDCLAVTLNAMGFKYRRQPDFFKKAARASYTVWAAEKLSEFKRYLVRQAFHRKPESPGMAHLCDRALDVILWVVTSGHILDMFDIKLGLALKSLLTFGGAGTLVLSLASKGIASELVSGFDLATSGRFLEGEKIQLDDGTKGKISRIGMTYTDIRGDDEIVARIPNSQLSQQKVRNLSRVTQSQVLQTLWFRYKDIAEIPALTEAIKDEVKRACPDLITDGSRPCRVHWRDFKDDHLEVVADFHFNIKAATSAYLDNKQVVLEAIGRAVERLGVEFALPTQICTECDCASARTA